MQDVPKIVQARLQRMAREAQAHPDADLLTAFAEEALTESERTMVMEHLARCGDCRDVVAMALPVTEDVVAAMKPASSARSGWFAWPLVRWGVVAAGILLVTAVGVRQFRQRTQQNAALVSGPVRQQGKAVTPSQSPQPPAQMPAAQAIVPNTSEMAKQSPMQKRTQTAAATEQPSPSVNALLPSSHPMHGAASSGGKRGVIGGPIGFGSGSGKAAENNRSQSQRDSFAFAPESKEARSKEATTAASRNSQMVEVQSETAQVTTIQNSTAPPAQNASSANLDVVKAKDSVAPQGAPSVPAPNVSLQTAPSLMQRASPRWTISGSGGLQRSFDAGKTWEDVYVIEDVSARSAFLARSSQKQSVAEYKSKDAGSKKVAEAQPKASLVFRAVAAIGPEVWAGGLGAMLYHSADSGTHWTRVTPSAGGLTLAGDVISIEFSDASHGTVITSNAERWSSADAGQTWHKQQ